MKYTIYKVTNLINNKIYIGKHQTKKPDDYYMGSGQAIKAAIDKYGIDNFLKELLFVFDNEKDMNQMERRLITEEFVQRTDTYNMGVGGEGGPHFKGRKHTAEAIKKITASSRGRIRKKKTVVALEYERRKRLEKNGGHWHSPEARRKISIAAKRRENAKRNQLR
ncbi:hypothetical protein KAR91_34260 [Candidatus Pacearchaeota archaeon]|nr:hypothetical protein [Candidatus Pacearchaeota archaeon]